MNLDEWSCEVEEFDGKLMAMLVKLNAPKGETAVYCWWL